jgi:serine protease Do
MSLLLRVDGILDFYRKRFISQTFLRKAFLLNAVVIFLTVFNVKAWAEYDQAKIYFDNLDNDTKISITLGLIATGDFDGLLDYGFTKHFYKAVNSFKSREGLAADGELSYSELKLLNDRAGNFYRTLGLRYYLHPDTKSELFVPRLAFDTETRTPHGFSFERNDKNLSLSFVLYPVEEKTFIQLYETLAQSTPQRNVVYKKLRDNYFVSSGSFKDRYFYTWMIGIQGGSTGFTLSWTPAWQEAGSRISILLANTFVSERRTSEAGVPYVPRDQGETAAAKLEEPPSSGTGTGFKVSNEGHVLTNYHVAGRCKKILLLKPGEIPIAAELVSSDETNDLALVKAQHFLGGSVVNFSSGALPRAGSDVAVYGFPLAGTLSTSGNIVTGNITALSGIGNDSRLFQISAPVQPGNSGGPVLDTHGSVIAVVVSKLNVLEMAKITGDIPQNVNFAIKANVATNFLEGIGINFQKTDPIEVLDTPTIADRAKGFTYLVECQN